MNTDILFKGSTMHGRESHSKNNPSTLRSSAFICGLLFLSLSAVAEVTVKEAWVRGTVPAQKSTGAFLTLTSTVDAKLVGAASPIASMVELHASEKHGDMMHMHAVDEVKLPAGKPVRLAPGGLHVMLMGLAKPVKAGDKVPLTLTIEDAKGARSQVEVAAEVRPLGK